MSILRKFWAIYAIGLFLLLMAVCMPVLLYNMAVTPGARALEKNIRFLHHVFSPVFLALVGIRLKTSGTEKLKPGASYVIIGNHQSSLDFILNAVAFPGVFRFLAKTELQKIPVFGWVVKKLCLTVDRSSAISRARSVVALKQHLNEGSSIFIYPEGSRNKTNEPLGEFFDGAFRIAIQTGAPIAVQTIVDMNKIMRPGALDLSPGTVHIVWDTPIETQNLSADDIQTLKEKTRNLMLQHLTSAG